MDTLTDRVLAWLLTVVIIGLIALCAGAAVWLAYAAVMELCNGRMATGAAMLAGTVMPAAAFGALSRWRNDLMDR